MQKNIKLPKRQAEVLHYLIRGKSAKLIAKEMNISFRTIQHYTEILKTKFNCKTKIELIDSALDQGFQVNKSLNDK